MTPSLSKTAVLDDLAARLAARRRQARQGRLAYRRLAHAIVGRPRAAAWPRPSAAAA